MRLDVRLVLAGLFAVVPSPANAQSQDDPSISRAADLTYSSRNLFAGIPYSDGSVIQANFALGYGGFTLNAYTNYDLRTREFNEGDIYADYYHQYSETIGFYLGAAYYNFKWDGEWLRTYEFYGGVLISIPGRPSLHYSRDFSLTKGGQLVRLALAHKVPVGAAEIIGTGNIVYNDKYYRSDSNFSHYDLSIGIAGNLGRVTVTPMVTYQNAIASDFENLWIGTLNFHGEF